MAKLPVRAMGKRRPPAQNDQVAEDSENGARRSPEDIVADAFLEHIPASATEGWSVRSRRTILLFMAAAGAVMVSAGLVLTGGLGPGPGRPRPIQAGPEASVLAQSLLRPLAEQQDVTTPSTAAASPLPTAPSSTVRRGEAPVVPSATPSTPSPVTQRKKSSSESQQATT